MDILGEAQGECPTDQGGVAQETPAHERTLGVITPAAADSALHEETSTGSSPTAASGSQAPTGAPDMATGAAPMVAKGASHSSSSTAAPVPPRRRPGISLLELAKRANAEHIDKRDD